MKKTELVKLDISRTLKEMCTHQSLESITVGALAKACGINRGTFYYHFKDIYDLIIWTFELEVAKPLEDYLTGHDYGTWKGIMGFCLEQMYNSKSFYCQALKIEGQNNLREYMEKRNYDCWKILMNKYIAATHGDFVHTDQYLNFFIKYTAQAVSNMIVGWAIEGMKIPVKEMEGMDQIATKGIYGVVDNIIVGGFAQKQVNPVDNEIKM